MIISVKTMFPDIRRVYFQNELTIEVAQIPEGPSGLMGAIVRNYFAWSEDIRLPDK